MNITFDDFKVRADEVIRSIGDACTRCGRRAEEVELLAVTKNHAVWAPEFAARYGLRAVGENRVQEGVEKREACQSSLQWELIGHLQSNKAKLAVSHFDRVQSIDSIKLATILDKAASATGKVLPILLQVNAGRDPAKFGAEIEDAPALLEAAQSLTHLRIDGLMTIAPLSGDKDVARRCFATLRTLRDELSARSGLALRDLSMGMSGDLVEAVLEGSTQIRVGTALFGARA